MYSSQYFAREINRWIEEIEYPSRPQGLYEPIKYMLAGGGKRLRPTLLCATAEAFGLAMDCVRNQAIAIEMFHNFTLLHDDVMDNASMRHGVPTVHVKWNVPTAILSGDTMLTLASKLMADYNEFIPEENRQVTDLFNNTAIEIYEGQQFDMNFESRCDVSEEEYLEMIKLKTAVLLGAACRIGAILAGASVGAQAGIYRYGVMMGMAFQLRDDYLDTFGDPATFGKEIGGDIANDKKTWLQIKARALAIDKMNEASQIQNREEKIERVTELYKSLGLDTACLELIDRYTDEALATIRELPLSGDDRNFFETLALSATRRTI